MLERSNEFTLYYLNQKLRDDLVFSEDALNKLLQIESQQPEFLRSTYTLATSAAGLINHWLVERKLPCYRRGRAIDDVTAEVVTVLDDDIGRAIDADDSGVSIKRGEFLSLLKEEGMNAPHFLLDTAGAPESETPPAFRPHIGWQIALFDAWPAICRMYGGRTPTAAEAIRYLQTNDKSGEILQKTDGGSLWWRTQRGKAKEATLHTVENTISNWRTRGVLPA